jgi:hypothetical protein
MSRFDNWLKEALQPTEPPHLGPMMKEKPIQEPKKLNSPKQPVKRFFVDKEEE